MTTAANLLRSGKKPWSPTDEPGCVLWLPTSAFALGGGTLTGTDRSGNANNCSVAATDITIGAASGGLPAFLSCPGTVGSENIFVTFAVPFGGAYSVFMLCRMDTAGSVGGLGGRLFQTNTPLAMRLVHDNPGPERTVLQTTAGFNIASPDVDAADRVHSAICGGGGSFLYQNGSLIASGAVPGVAASTTYNLVGDGPYIGGSAFRGRHYEMFAYDHAVTSLVQGKAEHYLKVQAGIP